MSLAGRVALVTGGTGALGRAVSLHLLGAGAAVAIPYLDAREYEGLVARVPPTEQDRLLAARVEVTDVEAMSAFAARAAAARGRLDILVAAVGGFAGGTLHETDLATWRRMLDLNLTSAFAATKATLPHMVAAGWGRIVLVASRAVVPPAAGFIAYTVAKAGVVALAQALAAETRGQGVTVNAVLPSTMDTAANRAAMPNADRSGWVPVEAVADAIALLVRPESAHITGTLLAI